MSMMFATLSFPNIDPVLVEIGPFAIRWYALAYIGGILLGWRYVLGLIKRPGAVMSPARLDDLILWLVLGIILGGRLGYVLFYNAGYYAAHPLEIFQVWAGGMSFHGGILGVALAIIGFSLKHRLPMLAVGDLIACTSPIGLFLGRIANFINGELFGRATDVPWAFVFPAGGPAPRHPSQLYEAGLEGVALFILLWILFRYTRLIERHGALAGIFLIGYSASRAFIELFR
ncbi:MAG: prolipoprotein diacylglyceryl transferase, partial [Sphingomonadales bacterium]